MIPIFSPLPLLHCGRDGRRPQTLYGAFVVKGLMRCSKLRARVASLHLSLVDTQECLHRCSDRRPAGGRVGRRGSLGIHGGVGLGCDAGEEGDWYLAQYASNSSSGRFFASFIICITLIELGAIATFGVFGLCAKMTVAPQIADMAVTRANADSMVFTASPDGLIGFAKSEFTGCPTGGLLSLGGWTQDLTGGGSWFS
jgi:hypothetical protein